jgi:nucleoside-diphosphate-sugar epimerase
VARVGVACGGAHLLFMTQQNILVTGGAGFIGSHLVERLLAEGRWRVTVVDDFNDFYAPALKRANVEPHISGHTRPRRARTSFP